MQLFVYDINLNPLGIVEAMTSLLWTRKFREPGELAVEVPATAESARLLQIGNIVMQPGSDEAMYIDYMSITRTGEDMDVVQAVGHTILSWLRWRLIVSDISDNDHTAAWLIDRLMDKNAVNPGKAARKLPLTVTFGTLSEQPELAYQAGKYSTLLDCIQELLALSGMGVICHTDVIAKTHTLEFVESTSKIAGTDGQCVFSTDWGSLGEHVYTHSEETHFSTVYVEGGNDIVEIENDSLSGIERKEAYLSATDVALSWTDFDGVQHTQTEARVRAKIKKRAQQALARDFLPELTFEGDALTQSSALQYRTDYDIGDIVTCMDERWGVSIDVVISEIAEEYTDGVRTVSLVFGEGRPTLR